MLVKGFLVARGQGGAMAIRQEISDEQWAVLAPLFPAPKATGRPPMDVRTTVEGIAWRFRTGAPWRDVPETVKELELGLSAVRWLVRGRHLGAGAGHGAGRGCRAENEVAWTVSVELLDHPGAPALRNFLGPRGAARNYTNLWRAGHATAA